MDDKRMTGRDILEEAFRQYDETYCDNFPLADTEIHFDASYYRILMRRIKKEKKHHRSLNMAGKRVAGIAIAIILFLGCSITAFAVREPLAAFFSHIYEEHIAAFFANTPQTIETVYLPKYLPDGYAMTECLVDDKSAKIVWRDQENKEIVFSQSLGLTQNLPGEAYDTITLSDIKVTFCREGDKKTFIWNVDGYICQCIVSEMLSDEECIAIILKTSVHISGDECLLTIPNDCTAYRECLLCKRKLGTPNAVHLGDGAWICEDETYHYTHCLDKTVLGDPCEQIVRSEHYFENGICIGCGYEKSALKDAERTQ